MRGRLFFGFIVAIFLMASAFAAENESFQAQSTRIISEIVRDFAIPADAHITLEFGEVDEASAWARTYPFQGDIITLDPEKLVNISDAQLTGLLAHELSHIEVYERMNWFILAMYGLRYSLSDSFKRTVEREADMLAIQHGFGEELLAYREYRLTTGDAEDVAFIRAYYLTVEDIQRELAA
jgi:Zn-dependent protease with chaperone function